MLNFRQSTLQSFLFLLIAFAGFIDSKEFAFKREFNETPPPFEKFYIDNSQLLSTPFGTYIKHKNGQEEQVRALMHDNYGTYVMRVQTQCPMCGQCYDGKCAPDGMCCPLYEKEVIPGVWISP